jgi:hypothetical protein
VRAGPYREPTLTPPEPPPPPPRVPWSPRAWARFGAGVFLAQLACVLAFAGTHGVTLTGRVVLGLAILPGAWCAADLFRRDAPLVARLFWTPILLVPVIGPVFYTAFFDPPDPQPDDLRARQTPGVTAYRPPR